MLKFAMICVQPLSTLKHLGTICSCNFSCCSKALVCSMLNDENAEDWLDERQEQPFDASWLPADGEMSNLNG